MIRLPEVSDEQWSRDYGHALPWEPGWAFVEIVILWLAIVATTVAFFRSSKIAGWLLVPYLGFSAVLNFTIWRLNVA